MGSCWRGRSCAHGTQTSPWAKTQATRQLTSSSSEGKAGSLVSHDTQSYEVEGSLRGYSARHLDRMVARPRLLPCALRRIHTFSWCKALVFGRTLRVYAGEAKMNSWCGRKGRQAHVSRLPGSLGRVAGCMRRQKRTCWCYCTLVPHSVLFMQCIVSSPDPLQNLLSSSPHLLVRPASILFPSTSVGLSGHPLEMQMLARLLFRYDSCWEQEIELRKSSEAGFVASNSQM
jgi:hypothetical protein